MTESEWLTTEDPKRMMHQLLTGEMSCTLGPGSTRWSLLATDRKLRLFTDAVEMQWFEDDYTPGKYSYIPYENALKNVSFCLHVHDLKEDQSWIAQTIREIFGNPFRKANLNPSWITPTVLKLAQAAVEELCWRCEGRGEVKEYRGEPSQGHDWKPCEACRGQGKVSKGLLDSQQLLVLSDALEEAGMPSEEPCFFCQDTGFQDPLKTGAPFVCQNHSRSSNPILMHLRGYQQVGFEDGRRGFDQWIPCGPHLVGCWAIDLILETAGLLGERTETSP